MIHHRDTLLEPPAQDWPLARAGFLLAACWAVLCWPWLSGQVTVPWDAKAHFYPQIQFLAQSLWRGESPFWAPYVFSGQPQVADPQAMIFSPPFLGLALLGPNPSMWAVDTAVFVTILIGAFALLAWFRDNGWHWAGALLAALAFAFGASMAWRIQHIGPVLSLAYLPIVVWLLQRALDRGAIGYGIAAGVVSACLVLNRDQVALLSVYFLIGFVIFRIATGNNDNDSADARLGARLRRGLAPLIAGGVAGVAIIALPVAMTVLVAAQSNRPEIDFDFAARGSLHPALFITFFAPDVFGSSGQLIDYWGPPSIPWKGTGLFISQNMGQLYIGAIPALLVISGLASGLLLRREVVYFTGALTVLIAFALGWYTPFFKIAHGFLPGVDLFRRPADATFLIGYLGAVLAGYTLHRMLSSGWGPGRAAVLVTTLVVAAAFASTAVLALQFGRVGQASAPFLIALGLVVGGALVLVGTCYLKLLRPYVAALLPIAFTVADLAWSNGPGSATALPPSRYAVLDPNSDNETIALIKRKVAEAAGPARRDRVELIGLGFHWPNAALSHRIETTLGYNPLRIGVYSQATGAHDTAGGPGDRWFAPLFPGYRTPLADLLGLRFIVSGVEIEKIDKRLKPGDLKFIARTRDGFVYENPRALPRVLYATSARRADFSALIQRGGLDADFRTTVLLEQPTDLKGTVRRPGRVRILHYDNTRIEIEADGPDGGWVVLNDIWHPWWTVAVDGKAAKMLRANVIFRAVEIAPGRHRIVFTFRPIAGTLSDLRGRISGN